MPLEPHLDAGGHRRDGDAGQLRAACARGVDRAPMAADLPAERADDEAAQPDAGRHQQEAALRVRVVAERLRSQRRGEHGQAAPSQVIDARPGSAGSRWPARRTATARRSARPRRGRRSRRPRPRRPPRQHARTPRRAAARRPARRSPAAACRAGRPAGSRPRPPLPGVSRIDQLGDVGDRVAAQAQQVGGEVDWSPGPPTPASTPASAQSARVRTDRLLLGHDQPRGRKFLRSRERASASTSTASPTAYPCTSPASPGPTSRRASRATPTATSAPTRCATRCSPRPGSATSARTSAPRSRSGPAPPGSRC